MPLPSRCLALACLFLALIVPAARAAEDALTNALRAADDERIAATIAADRARLAAIYSDALHYAHSNGKVDTKASQIEGLATGPNRFESFTYSERTFTAAGPGVASGGLGARRRGGGDKRKERDQTQAPQQDPGDALPRLH
jgi:hypothetical protein